MHITDLKKKKSWLGGEDTAFSDLLLGLVLLILDHTDFG